jgi:hypothetical protein
MAMKPPSKNIATSLKSQRNSGGRGPQKVMVGTLNYSEPAMTVPGEGMTSSPVGADRVRRPQDTAAVFAVPNSMKMGGRSE